MFKVKEIKTGDIYEVLDTYCGDAPFHYTYFLIWKNFLILCSTVKNY